jgi:ABC-type transport system involved in cytochrome c biogenesis permease subunit
MAAATVIEKYEGTDFVQANVYGSWWFILLWATLAVLSVAFMIKRRVKNVLLILLHLSFVIILLGAFITHVTSWQGMVHLSMNTTSETFFMKNAKGKVVEKTLPFKLTLVNCRTIYYPDTDIPKDWETEFMVNYETNGKVSMNNIYEYDGVRFYQSDIDEGDRGSVLALNYDPYGIPVTYCGYIMLFASLLIMLYANRGTALRFNVVAGLLTAMLCLYFDISHALQTDSDGYIIPVLNSPLFCVHVGIIMMAYFLLLLACVSSVAALVSGRQGFTRFSRLCLAPSIAALCFGIFIGAIWANVSWGTYWSWDAKEVWALITLMVYAPALHVVSVRKMGNEKFFNLYVALSFLTILMTYFGCNYFLIGMHSYV